MESFTKNHVDISMLNQRQAIESLINWWNMNGVETPSLTEIRHKAKVQAQAQNEQKKQTIIRAKQNLSNPDDIKREAQNLAENCNNLIELKNTLANFNGLSIKTTAKQMVFADGVENADIMAIGEAPGREEDEQGKPFVGSSGKLLEKMFNSIGLFRDKNLYITNTINWRPPGNRTPTKEEVAILSPFLKRHIELKRPKLLILVGAVASHAILQNDDGMGKLRVKIHKYQLADGTEVPVFCTYHPSYLLKRPIEKAKAWGDLLNIKRYIQKNII